MEEEGAFSLGSEGSSRGGGSVLPWLFLAVGVVGYLAYEYGILEKQEGSDILVELEDFEVTFLFEEDQNIDTSDFNTTELFDYLEGFNLNPDNTSLVISSFPMVPEEEVNISEPTNLAETELMVFAFTTEDIDFTDNEGFNLVSNRQVEVFIIDNAQEATNQEAEFIQEVEFITQKANAILQYLNDPDSGADLSLSEFEISEMSRRLHFLAAALNRYYDLQEGSPLAAQNPHHNLNNLTAIMQLNIDILKERMPEIFGNLE